MPKHYFMDGKPASRRAVRAALRAAGTDPDLCVYFASDKWWQDLSEKTGCSWKTVANQNTCVGKDGTVQSEGPGKGDKVGKLTGKLSAGKKNESRGKDVEAASGHLGKAKEALGSGDQKNAKAWLGTAHARLESASKGEHSGKAAYHQGQAKSFLKASKEASERGDVKKSIGLASQAHQHVAALHKAASKK